MNNPNLVKPSAITLRWQRAAEPCPGLRLAVDWHVRPGLSHGLRQAAISFDLWIRTAQAHELKQIIARIQQLRAVGSSNPLDVVTDTISTSDEEPYKYAIAKVFACLVVEAQQRLGFTVKDNVVVISPNNHPAWKGWHRFQIIIPFPVPDIASLVMHWLFSLKFRDIVGVDVAEQSWMRLITKAREQKKMPHSLNDENIVDAALRLNIPHKRLTRDLHILGLGSRSRWMSSTQTHATSSIGVKIARSKLLTAKIIRTYGLPAPVHHLAVSAQEAIRLAVEIGYPVVVKPENLDRGIGVYADLHDPDSVQAAWLDARIHSERVLIERHCPGFTHRLSVFNGRLVRVSRRIAGGVIGDGVSTVAELVYREQQTPHQLELQRRHGAHALTLDTEAIGLLQQHGLTPGNVPAMGQHVRLRRRDNINVGGRNELVSPLDIHSDNAELVLTVAKILGLDFAGVDLIIDDIGRSWRDGPSLICEVNAIPQLGAKSDPDTYLTVLNDLFPNGWSISAKLHIVPKLMEKIYFTALNQFKAVGHGISCRDGIWVSGCQVSEPFANSLLAGEALLLRPDVHQAVCIMTPGDVLSLGAPHAWWDSVELADESGFSPDELILAKAAAVSLAKHSSHQNNLKN